MQGTKTSTAWKVEACRGQGQMAVWQELQLDQAPHNARRTVVRTVGGKGVTDGSKLQNVKDAETWEKFWEKLRKIGKMWASLEEDRLKSKVVVLVGVKTWQHPTNSCFNKRRSCGHVEIAQKISQDCDGTVLWPASGFPTRISLWIVVTKLHIPQLAVKLSKMRRSSSTVTSQRAGESNSMRRTTRLAAAKVLCCSIISSLALVHLTHLVSR